MAIGQLAFTDNEDQPAGVKIVVRARASQSNFAPDSFTTLPQRAFSSRMNAPNCSGDMDM